MTRTTARKRANYTLLVMTVICELFAYLGALFLRYMVFEHALSFLYTSPDREFEFYRIFLVVVLLMRLILYFNGERNGKMESIWKQSSLELSALAIRQHFLLLVLLTLFIYFIRWSTRVSRTVMACLILLGIVFDVASRVAYSRWYRKRYGAYDRRKKVLLVTLEEEKERLSHCLNQFGYTNELKEVHYDFNVTQCIRPEELSSIDVSEFDYAYLSSGAITHQCILAEDIGIPVLSEVSYDGTSIPYLMTRQCGGTSVISESFLREKGKVLGVGFTVTSIPEAVRYLIQHRALHKGEYVCFSNVHTTVMASDDPAYCKVLNAAVYAMPDGNPIAKRLCEQGYQEAERVAGPDFMGEMFRQSAGTDVRHYFYGSSEETIEKLRESLARNYPGLRIAGMFSPPFRAMTEEEDREAVERINESGADFVWVGLGAPKQENWMNAHKGKINALMFGVGAAFDFHAGTVKRAPVLIQKLGLEWLYRLFQDPKRLFRRYVVTNTKFLWYTLVKKK